MEVRYEIRIVSKSVVQDIGIRMTDDEIIIDNDMIKYDDDTTSNKIYKVLKSDENYNFFGSKMLFLIMMLKKYIEEVERQK